MVHRLVDIRDETVGHKEVVNRDDALVAEDRGAYKLSTGGMVRSSALAKGGDFVLAACYHAEQTISSPTRGVSHFEG